MAGYVGKAGSTTQVDGYTKAEADSTFATTAQGTTADSALQNVVEDTTPQLGGTLDANGQTIDMGTNTITDTKVGQWDTAYGWGDHGAQGYATTSYVDTEVAGLVDSAPTTLDTLNELAAALGDDANFSTTVTNSLATKAPLASPALTGTPTAPTATANTNTTQLATTAYVQGELANEANWNTAYGWGDHSTQNYATTTGDTMTGDLSFGDNNKAIFGAGSDLQIYHDGTNSQIRDLGTGDLYIQASAAVSFTNTNASETYAVLNENGAVSLYYDNAVKLATTSTGIDVTGTVTADGVSLGDNAELVVGNSSDFKIFHNGDNTYMNDLGTGNLYISTNGAEVSLRKVTGNEAMLIAKPDAEVELYYDNSLKLETTSTGVDVTGTLTVNGSAVGGQTTAWVNFNGTGTPSIRDSYNVSSITDRDSGEYTVNFSSTMSNANYAVATGGRRSDVDNSDFIMLVPEYGFSLTTSGFAIRVDTGGSSPPGNDSDYIMCQVCGGT